MPDETPAGLTVADGGQLSDAQKSFINTNWRSAVEKDHAQHPSMADYNDLNGLTKSYINQQSLIGKDKLPMPQKDWKKEEWQDFNKKIGMPAEPKDYELKVHEGNKEEDIEWFQQVAHEDLMLSKKQANELWNKMNERTSKSRETFASTQKERLEKGYQALREEWGTNYDSMVKATNKGLQRLDEDGSFRKWMKDTGVNKEPAMLKFAAKIAQLFNEDQAPGDTRVPIPLSKDQAKAKAAKMMSDAMKDPKHPLMNKKDPAHDATVKEYNRYAAEGGA